MDRRSLSEARRLRVFGVAGALAMTAMSAVAEVGYQAPPAALTDLMDAPLPADGVVGPDRQWLMLLQPQGLSTIAELAEPELRLGGFRINPRLDAPSRGRPYVGLSLVRIADGSAVAVEGLPDDVRIEHALFSPDGRRIALAAHAADGEEMALWVVEVANGRARRVGDVALHLAAEIPPVWMPDGRGLLCTVVPAGRGEPPPAPRVPAGPLVRENLGGAAPARTYQDLLSEPYDEALFEYHLRAQLAIVDLEGGVQTVGEPDLLWNMDPSPDGRYLMVERLHRPFSYLVPAFRFPRRLEIWNRDGTLARLVADVPLQEAVPTAFGSVPTGPRDARWRADAEAELVWVEALDGGDALREADHRDQLFVLAAPFTGSPRPWATLSDRLRRLDFGSSDVAVVTETWWKTRTVRMSRLRPGDLDAPAEVVYEGSYEDRYALPGEPVVALGAAGREVLVLGPEGHQIYLAGQGASPEGDRPFLDRLDLASGETERLVRSAAPSYEEPLLPLDAAGTRILVRRESADEPPDYFVRTRGGGETDDALDRLTTTPDPAASLRGMTKELIQYPRADGVTLSATLYLPPGYTPDQGPLPMLMWAYPREFKSADAAGQVAGSPYRFSRVDWRSSVPWLTQGYAVLDGPAMPVVGEGDAEPNDSFRDQLVANAQAAVDEVVRRGVAKPGHIAIGGHSYGAFMTANLLAHSNLFAAGIARSGAYNRTLTPFGFQSEERSFWEAPEIYFAMSPFMHVEKIDEPLLLIHGDADNNSGTFPIQSERLYAALKGHGATARLVMLPHESHGYRARESILHMLWETHQWMERYVRRDLGRAPSLGGAGGTRGVP